LEILIKSKIKAKIKIKIINQKIIIQLNRLTAIILNKV